MKLSNLISLATVLLIALVIAPLSSFAQTERSQTGAEIAFEAGDDPVPALDPDDPDSPLTGNPEGILENPAAAGALSLNVVPQLTFADSDGKGFPAQTVGDRVYPLYRPQRPYVQVSDLRGTGGGWKLTVSADPFRGEGGDTLHKTQIRMLHGTSRSSNATLNAPEINPLIIIDCAEDSAPVVIADTLGTDTGMGAWIIRWYPLDANGNFTETAPEHRSTVDLFVPAGSPARSGTYTTTLHWTLTDSV